MRNDNLKRELLKLSKISKSDYDNIKDKAFFVDGVMYATDFDKWYSFTINNCTGHGSFDLKTAKKLLAKLKNSDEVEIVGNDDELIFKTKMGDFKLPGSDKEEYPSFPVFDEVENFITGFNETDKLETSAKFVSKDDMREAMTYIYIGNDVYNGVAATDAHKLYFEAIENEMPNKSVLIDPVVAYLFKDDSIDISIGKNNDFNDKIIIKSASSTYVQKIPHAKFPNISAIIPDNQYQMKLSKKELLDKLEFALLASGYKSLVVFEMQNGIQLGSKDLDYELSYNTHLKGNFDADMKIGFDGNHLKAILKKCEEDVTITYKEPSRSVVINDKFLLMPRKII